MALVFKIKYRGTLRRWVVSSSLPESSSAFPITVKELDGKLRELFHVPADKVFNITYVDKEGDVVTLADDQDLWDACVVQSLNPLRLDVQIDDIKHNIDNSSATEQTSTGSSSVSCEHAHASSPSPGPGINGSSSGSSKPPFPQVTADAIKQFLNKYTQTIDPNLQPAVILRNIQKALKDFLKTVVHEGQRLAPHVPSPGRRPPAYTRCASEPPLRSPSTDSLDPVVHVGVTCDECNCSPIQGLRYKSTKIFNYDLCSDCFAKIGNETDYQKLDKPVRFVHPGFHPSCSKGPNVPGRWAAPFASGTDGWNSQCPFLRTKEGCPPTDASKELDAIVLKDLTVFNGDEVTPGSEFQWIVRLKNNGLKPWPQATKFIHLSGNKLTAKLEVDLKLPAPGLSVGSDVEICLDMRAPDTAGNYISHWCLAAPSGKRIGKTVWVALRVVSPQHGSSVSSLEVQPSLDEVDDDKAGGVQGVDDDKAGAVPQASIVERPMKSVSPPQEDMGMADSPMEKREVARSVGWAENGEKEGSQYGEKGGNSSVKLGDEAPPLPSAIVLDEENADGSDDVDGFSMIEKPVNDAGSFKRMMRGPVASSQLTFPQSTREIQEQYARMINEEIVAQDMKLRQLDSMGFKNQSLNEVLLKKNKQDLQLTLDDLLLGSGWDNLLKDLLDMGFTDTHTNLRLLIKNEGSLNRVVRELIELEKSQM